jgi:hypothetical protein
MSFIVEKEDATTKRREIFCSAKIEGLRRMQDSHKTEEVVDKMWL